jgi:hypothetical protein
MKAQLQVPKVEDCLQWLESSAQDYTATQSIGWLIDHVGQLCNMLAFVNNQMAVAKKLLNDKKVTAYHSLITSEVANEKYFAPSLAKDYVASQCSEEQYAFDLCERASRTVTHILEILRTVISALKEESKQLHNHKDSNKEI